MMSRMCSIAMSIGCLYIYVAGTVANWYVPSWLVYYLLHYVPSALLRAKSVPPFFVWRRRRRNVAKETSEGGEEEEWVQFSNIELLCPDGRREMIMAMRLRSITTTRQALWSSSYYEQRRVMLLSLENGYASTYRHVSASCHAGCISVSRGKKTDPLFLFAEYSHPSTPMTKIELHLEGEIFCEGNEILSRIFVLRLLTFQSIPFVFTENYRLTIVDDGINEFQIGWNEYIFIEKGEGGGGPKYSIRFLPKG